jgi:hypothetical protein
MAIEKKEKKALVEDKKDEKNILRYYRRKGSEEPDYLTIMCLITGMAALFTEVMMSPARPHLF